jgi:hypothetical protein
LLPLLRELGWFRHTNPEDVRNWLVVIPISLMAIAVLLALRLALANHQSAERSWRRIRTQAVAFSALFLAATAVLGAGEAAAVREWRYVDAKGVHVTGRIVFDGATPPPSLVGVDGPWVFVVPDDHDDDSSVWTPIRNGVVTTPYFYPDRYTLRVLGAPKAFGAKWAFRSATYQGRNISDTPIDIKTNLDDVLITFTDRLGTIGGDVRDAAGAPMADALVLLFPVDRVAWADYRWTSRSIRAMKADVDGTFNTPMLPDGDYLLVAVPFREAAWLNKHSSSWRERINITEDPRPLFEKFAGVAERIHAREGETITRTLIVQRPR